MLQDTISKGFPVAMTALFFYGATARQQEPTVRVLAAIVGCWAAYSFLHTVGWI